MAVLSYDELLNLVNESIVDSVELREPKRLYEPQRYLLGLGGKRIRPVLCLMSCQLFSGDPQKALSQAIALELFHNFTLAHDDIMDDAPIRRGMQTMHEKWNANVAILSGDAMLIESYRHLISGADEDTKEIIEVFNERALEVCEGQQMDMDFEEAEDIGKEDYLKMIGLKTAVLLAGSLEIGAIRAGASKEQRDHIAAFGYALGIAFQIKDDILDAFGDPKNFGKQVGGDILARKKTILYVLAMEHANESQRQLLGQQFDNGGKVDLRVVLDLFEALGVKRFATEVMQSYSTDAKEHLDALEDSFGAKRYLEAIIHKLSDRTT